MAIDSQRWSSYDESTTKSNADEPVENSFTDKIEPKSVLSTAMYNRLLFGALVGFPTGAMFGASKSNMMTWHLMKLDLCPVDGIRTYQKYGKVSSVTTNAIAKTAVWTGASFSRYTASFYLLGTIPYLSLDRSFFLTYQGVKAALEFKQETRIDAINISVATAAATIPFLKVSYFRKNIPYALMLVALDYFHSE